MGFFERFKQWVQKNTPVCVGCDKVAPHGVNPERFESGEKR